MDALFVESKCSALVFPEETATNGKVSLLKFRYCCAVFTSCCLYIDYFFVSVLYFMYTSMN